MTDPKRYWDGENINPYPLLRPCSETPLCAASSSGVGQDSIRRMAPKEISGSDMKWLLQYIGRISDDQIRVGLKASGATQEESQCFTKALRDRILQMQIL